MFYEIKTNYGGLYKISPADDSGVGKTVYILTKDFDGKEVYDTLSKLAESNTFKMDESVKITHLGDTVYFSSKLLESLLDEDSE